jgi:septum site-determining protein MinD
MATVFAVASGKGGVGKTTTAAALGSILSVAGNSVVVVDADLGMPNLAETLGVDGRGRPNLNDALSGTATVLEVVYQSQSGPDIVPGGHDLQSFAEADPGAMTRLLEPLSGYDYVLFDTGAGLSHDSVLPLGLADAVLLVSTPEPNALRDTERTRQVSARLGGYAAGVVLTRVPNAGPDIGLVRRILDTTILEAVPEDGAVASAMAAENALVNHAPDSPAVTAYRRLASTLIGDPIPRPAGNVH